MSKKDLTDAVLPSIEERHEWQSFLGLLPALDLSGVDPVLYQRCLVAVWQFRETARISRNALLQASGLGFHGPALECDLLLAALVGDEVIEPIVSSPFCFRVRDRNWTDPESAYAADESSALIDSVRQEQLERFRIFEELDQRLKNQGLREKRVRATRAEIDRLRQIYESTWAELADAVGSKCAETIRSDIERSIESVTRQLDLPLSERRNSDLEGEDRCNK